MRLIVGLGNPGADYEHHRHNIGFRVVDAFASRHRLVFDGHEKDALTARGRVAGQAVMLAKPLTYMNRSGKAVAGLVRAYLEGISDLLVVYDEIDLPIGRLRIRENGSGGTHNGMASILESLGSGGFPRLRFGIRGPSYSREVDLADYVLSDFEPQETEVVEDAVERSRDALLMFVRGDLRRAMNTFNRDPEPETSADDPTPPNAR